MTAPQRHDIRLAHADASPTPREATSNTGHRTSLASAVDTDHTSSLVAPRVALPLVLPRPSLPPSPPDVRHDTTDRLAPLFVSNREAEAYVAFHITNSIMMRALPPATAAGTLLLPSAAPFVEEKNKEIVSMYEGEEESETSSALAADPRAVSLSIQRRTPPSLTSSQTLTTRLAESAQQSNLRYKCRWCQHTLCNVDCPYTFKCLYAHRPEEVRTIRLNELARLTTIENIRKYYRRRMSILDQLSLKPFPWLPPINPRVGEVLMNARSTKYYLSHYPDSYVQMNTLSHTAPECTWQIRSLTSLMSAIEFAASYGALEVLRSFVSNDEPYLTPLTDDAVWRHAIKLYDFVGDFVRNTTYTRR